MLQDDTVILPRGVSAEQFAEAVAKFRGIVGEQYVATEPDHLRPYTKLMMPAKKGDHLPSGAIMPKTVEEVQAILGVCNEYKVPVWPISTGRNSGYGYASPAQTGTMMLDLRRMNRILEVNAEMGYALVEPGCTYHQLAEYIDKNNLNLMMSFPAPSGIAGPVGNTLERGVGYTPYGEHFLFQCGMEVVLANGKVLRTGMGSMPNSNTWQVFKWGYGPALDGIFSQSNYGIVTKLGFWLLPRPPGYKPFVVKFPNDEDIVKAVEIIRPMRINQIVGTGGQISNSVWEVAVTTRRQDLWQGKGAVPDDVIRDYARKKGYGAWNFYSALYGTPEQIDVSWKIVKGAFEANGGKVMTDEDMEPNDLLWQYRRDLMWGKLTMREFSLYNWIGGGGSAWFVPVSQAHGKETLKQIDLAKTTLAKYGLDYVMLFVVGMRDMHHVVDLLYDRTDPERTEQVLECYRELIRVFADNGYGIYRTGLSFMDQVAKTYGPVKHEVNIAIKRALDPNGIIAPGKSGISL